MKRYYPWLWFDADGTLFDYNRAEGIALQNAFQSVNVPFKDEYLEVYRGINRQLWQALEQQQITPALLRVRRFELLIEATQLGCAAEPMSSAYIEQLAVCGELIDGACEVLESLQKTCKFAIITNGLKDVQRTRLAHSAIRDYFAELIISDEVGAAKPNAAFFAAAFARTGNPPKSDVLIIGDSLASDMRGGVNYGVDTCWYNPTDEPRPADLPITYQVRHLRDLLALV